MPEYDGDRFQPPAPVAHVVVRHPDDGPEQRDVPMLIDSGADVSLIPQWVIETLQLGPLAGHYELVGFDDKSGEASAYHATLILLGKTYRGRYLAIDQQWGILGRNILNTMVLTLDGPGKQWR